MENKQRNGMPIKKFTPGIPLNEKQITQGFRISGGIDGILKRLFNMICLDSTNNEGVSPVQWNKLMIDYIKNIGDSNTSMDRSSIRGNMNKELHRPSMTWNVLCKGLQFLKFEACTVSVYGDLHDGREFNAYTSISFVDNSKFRHLFPKELLCGNVVFRKESKNKRFIHRTFSNNYRCALAKLFNLICLDITKGTGFSRLQWNSMLTAFINETEGPLEADKRMNVRSNLNKEFLLSKMTWKVFCKGLRFLQVESFTIHMTVYRDDGNIFECETPINFAPRS